MRAQVTSHAMPETTFPLMNDPGLFPRPNDAVWVNLVHLVRRQDPIPFPERSG